MTGKTCVCLFWHIVYFVSRGDVTLIYVTNRLEGEFLWWLVGSPVLLGIIGNFKNIKEGRPFKEGPAL